MIELATSDGCPLISDGTVGIDGSFLSSGWSFPRGSFAGALCRAAFGARPAAAGWARWLAAGAARGSASPGSLMTSRTASLMSSFSRPGALPFSFPAGAAAAGGGPRLACAATLCVSTSYRCSSSWS